MSELSDAKQIPRKSFLGEHLKIKEEMKRIIVYFFSNPTSKTLTFRGFILDGEPASGKTELAKQVAREIAVEFSTNRAITDSKKVILQFIDSSHIAAAKFGEAEQNIRMIFKPMEKPNELKIMLFDDLDCIMIKRGENVSREWHYSMNSVMFHQLDNIDPTKVIFIGTTNRADLLDPALYSRLISYKVPKFSLESLMAIADDLIDEMHIDFKKIDGLKKRVKAQLKNIADHEEHIDVRVLQNILTKLLIAEVLRE